MTDAAMIFAILTLLGLIFMVISLLISNAIIGVISGIIAMVIWYTVGGWWLDMQTSFPGIAMLFWSFGKVCLVIVAYGSFKVIFRREEPILE